MGDNILYNQNKIVKFDKFTEKKYITMNCFIVLFFSLLFIIVGFIEKNLILPQNGLGLFQHVNIWIFLTMNFMIPIAISKIFKSLKNSINTDTLDNLKSNFKTNAGNKSTIVLSNLFRVIGFCCFVGNSLQNANIINQLPFDYWDSNKYILSYIISRIYKFYLFVYFIPLVLIYVFILIKSISKLLTINETELGEYPIKNYEQLNTLCNFGLNILLTILVPFILSSCEVYFIHDRFDITTITTIVISAVSTVISICMYVLLIKEFYVSVIEYKKKNIELIDFELSKIHQYVLNAHFSKKNNRKLEVYLKKEKYLCQIKERIDDLSKFPLIIKAIFTSISPFIPAAIKIAVQLLNTFFNAGILATIL